MASRSADDIILLHLGLEPLIDLIFSLCAVYHFQPVAAWSLGILGGDDLNTVSILDLIFNRNQFSVDSCANHLISHCTVYRISKINGGKISAAQIEACAAEYYDNAKPEYLTEPKMVYISFPTEQGTLYTKESFAI